jgi:hypothetical protein
VVISVADLGDFGPDPVPDPTSGKNGTGSDLWKKKLDPDPARYNFWTNFFSAGNFCKNWPVKLTYELIS